MSSRRPRTLIEYLRAARSRKLLVITTALVFAAAAWLALKRQPNLYQASSLNVESKSGDASDAVRSTTPAPSPSADIEALRQRALELSARLREMEAKSPWLLSLKESAPAAHVVPRNTAPSPDTARAQQLTIESLKDRQYLIQQQLADVEQRVSSVRQIVEQQKKGSSLRDNPTYAALIARRTELQGQRDTLVNRQELTDKHPRVAAIIDQIAAINRQIDELRQQDANQANQSPEGRELRSLESERNRLKLELEINNRELARRSTVAAVPQAMPAPSRDVASSPAAQVYFGLKRSYEDAMARLDNAEAKLSMATPAASETPRVAEVTTAPQRPTAPPRWLLVLSAFGVGLTIGTIVAVALESRQFATVQDARDVDFYTRLPLLAAIPKTVTDDERRCRSRRAMIRLAVGAILAVAATAALTAAFVAVNIFSLISRS